MTIQHPRFLAFIGIFAIATGGALAWLPVEEAVILGFDAAAIAFIALSLRLWMVDAPEDARARAARDDGGRVLLMLTAAAVLAVILLALGRMILQRSGLDGTDFAVVVGTLALAWAFSNLVYAFHYAHLYYDQAEAGDAGGIIFPEGGEPVFADFVYFALVIGMTCQTADLDISSRRIRRVVTAHGMFAFFFNLGVLALTINVLSNVL